jgi:hypothetical protein
MAAGDPELRLVPVASAADAGEARAVLARVAAERESGNDPFRAG